MPARHESEEKDMLVRIGDAGDVTDGQMRVYDVAGTNVNVSNASGHLFAIDDTCTHGVLAR
jgi:nitrite reductase/ring-hydroxylating ferredoxin subunit